MRMYACRSVQNYLLMPGQSLMYTWDNPSEKHEILWKFMNKTKKYRITSKVCSGHIFQFVGKVSSHVPSPPVSFLCGLPWQYCWSKRWWKTENAISCEWHQVDQLCIHIPHLESRIIKEFRCYEVESEIASSGTSQWSPGFNFRWRPAFSLSSISAS